MKEWPFGSYEVARMHFMRIVTLDTPIEPVKLLNIAFLKENLFTDQANRGIVLSRDLFLTLQANPMFMSLIKQEPRQSAVLTGWFGSLDDVRLFTDTYTYARRLPPSIVMFVGDTAVKLFSERVPQ